MSPHPRPVSSAAGAHAHRPADPTPADARSAPASAGSTAAGGVAPVVEPEQMALPAELTEQVINRLRRAEGQLRGVQRLLAEGADCGKILTQLAAANRAVEQAGFRLVAGGLAWCAKHPEAAAAAGYQIDELERLFTRIA